MSHRDSISPSFAAVTFRKIYKTTTDDSLARAILHTVRAIEPHLPDLDTAIDTSDIRSLRWHTLRPLLMELIRRKCARSEYAWDASQVEAMVATHWEDMFPSKAMLSQKIVAAFLLGKLGIASDTWQAEALEDIRAHKHLLDRPGEYYYMSYLYAVTHVIFVYAGYYDRYLDAADFEPEIAAFRTAIQRFLRSDYLDPMAADIASEILISAKLLRLPVDADIRELQRILMNNQNRDGSWGSSGRADNPKIHTTAVATLALMDFTPEFRPGDVFCDSDTYE
jgi:hypothetical protein